MASAGGLRRTLPLPHGNPTRSCSFEKETKRSAEPKLDTKRLFISQQVSTSAALHEKITSLKTCACLERRQQNISQERICVKNIYVMTLEMQISDFRGENPNLRLLMQLSDLEKLRSRSDVHKLAG